MPDSGKFKDLYLNSALTYPCQPPLGMDGEGNRHILFSTGRGGDGATKPEPGNATTDGDYLFCDCSTKVGCRIRSGILIS